MKRQLEPELMEEAAQVEAYATADFNQPNSHFMQMFSETFGKCQGHVLDLGCGPGDISLRFASTHPDCLIHAVDGSDTMLAYGRKSLEKSNLNNLQFFNAHLPCRNLPRPEYDAVISNSLLHHLPDPQILWQTIRNYGKAGCRVFIMDLIRPETLEQARSLVETHANDEPGILQHDFYHSLLAAFEVGEVRAQLQRAELELSAQTVSDRHFIVHGTLQE